MGKKRKHSEAEVAVTVKKDESAEERPKRTLLGWKDKDKIEEKVTDSTVFRNKERVLVTCSRRINYRWCKEKKMSESQRFQLGTVGALTQSVASSVSIVICNKALISTLSFNFECQPEMTWNRMEFSVMLEHVQAHVAPTDVDPGPGLQRLPKIRRSSPKVKRTGALLERVFMPCDIPLHKA